jgi:hypothetical protein
VYGKDSSFPPVLFIFPADLDEGREFFDEFWPEARAVSDPKAELFKAMGVNRASLRQLFGPGVWIRAMQARQAGASQRGIIGNPWLMPGMFLVREDHILWQWRYRNVGDHPDLDQVAEAADRLRRDGPLRS